MRREFKVEANVGKPQVAYRETIRVEAKDVQGKHAKQSGGRGQYGHVVIDIFPLEEGAGYTFTNDIKGGVIPGEFIPGVDKGIREQLKSGPLAGYPVVDVVFVCTSVLTMMSTLQNWRLKSQLLWHSNQALCRLNQFCWNL